jgi:glycosyltransferase involved in cell wall biosynthesis
MWSNNTEWANNAEWSNNAGWSNNSVEQSGKSVLWSMNSTEWHLITSEYPPLPGGVSDYTRLIAEGLAAAGDSVHVWCPHASGEFKESEGITVHRELGAMKPTDWRRVGRLLERFPAPRRLLVQWVPHGYGYRSMNLPFCVWLWKRARVSGDDVELMVHEPFLQFGEGNWKQNGVAAVHRLMTTMLLNAARRVWLSIPAWEQLLRPFALGRRVRFDWLPVASTIPLIDDAAGTDALRDRLAPGGARVVGHFGTYGKHLTELLLAALPALMSDALDQGLLLLIGRGSVVARERLVREFPELAQRVYATGALCAEDLSRHVRACDLMVQPFPDGVSSRRTSAMVGLSHGRPIVTTSGPLTESFWSSCGAVILAPVGDVAALVSAARRLLEDEKARACMSAAASSLYRERFDVRNTVAALRNGTALESLS